MEANVNLPGFTADVILGLTTQPLQGSGRKLGTDAKHFGPNRVKPAGCTCNTRLDACEDHVGYVGCICVPGNGRFYKYMLPVASC
jgi:hypothetical protein